jgi:hypothetical protein
MITIVTTGPDAFGKYTYQVDSDHPQRACRETGFVSAEAAEAEGRRTAESWKNGTDAVMQVQGGVA